MARYKAVFALGEIAAETSSSGGLPPPGGGDSSPTGRTRGSTAPPPAPEEEEPWDAPAEPPKLPKAKSPPRRRAPPARRGSGYRSGASSLSEPLEKIAEASDEDGAAAVGDCAVGREALGAGLRVEVCVQRPEELIVIPAGTAHMVVHGAGSVGVAGQHCNTANEERVGAHALRRCRGNVRVAAEGREGAVEAAIIAANGKERGEAICDVLWQEWDAYTA